MGEKPCDSQSGLLQTNFRQDRSPTHHYRGEAYTRRRCLRKARLKVTSEAKTSASMIFARSSSFARAATVDSDLPASNAFVGLFSCGDEACARAVKIGTGSVLAWFGKYELPVSMRAKSPRPVKKSRALRIVRLCPKAFAFLIMVTSPSVSDTRQCVLGFNFVDAKAQLTTCLG